MGKIFSTIQNFIMNSEDLILMQMFDVTAQLVNDQEEIQNTDNFVMWVILPNNADSDCFKTLTLREILKIQNPLREEHCAFWEVILLFQ